MKLISKKGKKDKMESNVDLNELLQNEINQQPFLHLYGTTYDLNMLNDYDCDEATRIYPLNIVKANKKYRKNPKNYINLIPIDPYILFDAPEEIKNNEELANLAIKKDIWTSRAISSSIYGLEKFQRELSNSKEIKKWEKTFTNENEKEHMMNVIDRLLAKNMNIDVESLDSVQYTKNIEDIKKDEQSEQKTNSLLDRLKKLETKKPEDKRLNNEKEATKENDQNTERNNINQRDDVQRIEKSQTLEEKQKGEITDYFYDSSMDDFEMLSADEKETDDSIELILKEWKR